ncbi:MAG: histidinol-phosphate transaminase [Planctomyces sp.]|nr:histidinol-phosphate transaminase [Planctomyces sp.]
MSLFRPAIDRTDAYLPGEQPQEAGWVKLNTNENPYPPSPRALEAIAAASQRLHVYPDPLATGFRRAVAELFQVDPDWILPANGSDENLTMLMRTFIEPGDVVDAPYPSYILYETLAGLQDGTFRRLPLNADWSWNHAAVGESIDAAKLVIVPNPNSPSGNRWDDGDLLRLLPPRGVLVVDEAYGDFCDVPHRMELLRGEDGKRIIVTRTLSKSYSLAGLRLGFAVAHPDLIAGMRKVKDSYNCDALSLAGGEAAIRDQAWMLENRGRILATRTRMTETLRSMGFEALDSQANFVWATRAAGDHRAIYDFLKSRKVLVRLMRFPDARPGLTGDAAVVEGLRITVGTDEQVDRLLAVLAEYA